MNLIEKFYHRRYLSLYFVICSAILLRFAFLGIYPPTGEQIFFLRFITAVASIVSIVLMMFLVSRSTHNYKLAIWSGFWLAFMPWHLEQSRIFSEVMFGLLALLGAGVLWQIGKCKKCKIVIIFTCAVILWRVMPNLWIFHPPYQLPTIFHFISNLFKLISIEFLFYKNETFWLGGFRTIGVLLPATIPIFVMGLFQIIKKANISGISIVIFLLIWLLSAANPTFPEGREFFLTVPFIAYILANGANKYIQLFQNKSFFIKCIPFVFFLIVLYDYIFFFHQYIIHYSQRIKNEIPYEQRTF